MKSAFLKRALLLAVLAATLLPGRPAVSETLVLDGLLDGTMHITQVFTFAVEGRVSELGYRFAVPGPQEGRTVTQTIRDLTIDCDPRPVRMTEETDDDGNTFKVATWKDVTRDVTVTVRYTAVVRSVLSPISSTAPFPVGPVSGKMAKFLKPTEEVQSDDARIVTIARHLTEGLRSQHDAVIAIINFAADTIAYTHNPARYDALHTLTTKKGNCTNISHAALALLRSAGIPARMVGGIGLKKRWVVPTGSGGNLIQGFVQGSHAWIEVYYPDAGWLPYDVQQTKHFTSTRHISKTRGGDLHGIADTWWGTPYLPRYSTHIEESFLTDTVSVRLKAAQPFPRTCILSTEFNSASYAASLPPVKPEPPKPDSRPDKGGEIVIGNLEFPAFVDLYRITGNRAVAIYDSETAEYATSARMYAQAFHVPARTRIDTVSLALMRYGGDGTIYVDVVAEEDGRPGHTGFRSMPVGLEAIGRKKGYGWVDFPLPQDVPSMLEKGRYWIILRHSGEAVVNWFFSPGKRFGGMYDTRSTAQGYAWEDVLGFDFVFKVSGHVAGDPRRDNE